ncbi:MAG: hypothetical protein CBE07_003155 [Pelagibacteraceae bacterium TMED247]|nr:MAG: hypothetical protein CBE07_003155 [Pelagibacteraceae bacterium TMED247]
MENWRQFLNESDAPEQQELDEGVKEKMFAALMGLFALGASGDVEAKTLNLGGGDTITVQAAAKGLKAKGDSKAAQTAQDLAKILSANPPDNNKNNMIDVADSAEVGANTLDSGQIDLLKSLKGGEASPSSDAKPMSQKDIRTKINKGGPGKSGQLDFIKENT